MKTSSYIFIAFILFIIASIIIYAATAIGHETKRTGEGMYAEYPLGEYNTLVIKAPRNLDINLADREKTEGNTNTLTVFFPKNTKAPANFYRINNDTLFLDIPERAKIFDITLHCEGLASIKADGGQIASYNYSYDSLHVTMKLSSIYFSRQVRIKNLEVDAVMSNFNGYLEKTKINALNIRLSDDSHFNLTQKGYSDRITLERDSTSRYSITCR